MRRNRLSEELFALVEYYGGMAHISDGTEHFSEVELLKLAEKALKHHEHCVRLLNGFLYHHHRRIALKMPYKPYKTALKTR